MYVCHRKDKDQDEFFLYMQYLGSTPELKVFLKGNFITSYNGAMYIVARIAPSFDLLQNNYEQRKVEPGYFILKSKDNLFSIASTKFFADYYEIDV